MACEVEGEEEVVAFVAARGSGMVRAGKAGADGRAETRGGAARRGVGGMAADVSCWCAQGRCLAFVFTFAFQKARRDGSTKRRSSFRAAAQVEAIGASEES